MTVSIRALVYEAFDHDSVQPPLSPEVQAQLQSSEGRDIWEELKGKRWGDIASTDTFQSIVSDVLELTSRLPLSWYIYYLPALLIVADEGTTGPFENLRGILCEHFELTENSCRNERDALLRDALRTQLNEKQRAVVKKFLEKNPA